MNQNGHKRIAVILSSPVSEEQRDKIKRGLAPRHDILTLADRLGATVIHPDGQGWGKAGALSRLRQMTVMAWKAFRRRKEYDIIVADLDAIGAVLALLFKLTRTRRRLVVICHGKMSRGAVANLSRFFRLHRQIDHYVCYGPAVAKIMVANARIPAEKVTCIRHPADHRFWKPTDRQSERLISSAGFLFRDYVTLANAVRGLDVKVQLAAFSPWMNPKTKPPDVELPENVTFTRLPQDKLRDLYDRSLFVVVPLKPTFSHPGSLVIYEAMAMGKAIVLTESEGEKALNLVTEGETGIFFTPGDVDGLRAIIQDLLDNPEKAKRMGMAARARVESGMNLDKYLDEMVAIVRSVSGEPAQQPERNPVNVA